MYKGKPAVAAIASGRPKPLVSFYNPPEIAIDDATVPALNPTPTDVEINGRPKSITVLNQQGQFALNCQDLEGKNGVVLWSGGTPGQIEELFRSPAPLYQWLRGPNGESGTPLLPTTTPSIKIEGIAMFDSKWILTITDERINDLEPYIPMVSAASFNWSMMQPKNVPTWNPNLMKYQMTLINPRPSTDGKTPTKILAIGTRPGMVAPGSIPFTLVFDNGETVFLSIAPWIFRRPFEEKGLQLYDYLLVRQPPIITTDGRRQFQADRNFKVNYKPSAAAFSSGGDFLALGVHERDHHIDLLNMSKTDVPVKKVHTWPLEGKEIKVQSLAVSPNGNLVAAGFNDSTICLYDSQTPKAIVRFKADGVPFRLMFDPSSHYLVAGVGKEVGKNDGQGRVREEVGKTLTVDDPGSKIQFWMLPPDADPK
jgi:hypothetical protein